MKKETLAIKVNNEALRKIYGIGEDGIINVDARKGIPKSREWRNRLRDSAIDQCVSLVKPKAKSTTVKKKESENADS